MRNFNETTGAASAAPFTASAALSTSTLTVANANSRISIASFSPFMDAAALRAAADAKSLFDAVLNSEAGRPYLFDFAPKDLIDRGAHLIVARDGDTVVGTMHFHRDGPGRLTFRSAVVHPAYAGQKLCSAMGAVGLLHDFVANGEADEVHCAVRVLPTGQINEPSKISFSRLGFMLDVDSGRTYLRGSFRDRHLFKSAEIDTDGSVFTRYRKMTAGPEAVDRARAFLDEWSQDILPFPLHRLP